MTLENEYKKADFSVLSKVKESLRQKIHHERRAALNGVKVELNFDDLDMLAAAGNSSRRKYDSDDEE